MDRRTALITGGSLVVSGTAGCLDQGITDSNEDLIPVNMTTVEGGTAAIRGEVLKEEEMDHEHGLDIELTGTSPSRAMQLLVSEAVDLGLFSVQGAATANLEGNSVRFIAPDSSTHLSLMSKEYSSLEELERIGTPAPPSGTFNHGSLLFNLLGYDFEEDFDLRSGDPGAGHSLDSQGEVDAHLHFPPVSVQSMVSNDFNEIIRFYEEFQKEDVYGATPEFTVFAGLEGWINENTEATQRFQDMMIDVNTRLLDETEELLREYPDLSGYETDEEFELGAEFFQSQLSTDWEQVQTEITNQLEISKEIGLIDEEAPTNLIYDL